MTKLFLRPRLRAIPGRGTVTYLGRHRGEPCPFCGELVGVEGCRCSRALETCGHSGPYVRAEIDRLTGRCSACLEVDAARNEGLAQGRLEADLERIAARRQLLAWQVSTFVCALGLAVALARWAL